MVEITDSSNGSYLTGDNLNLTCTAAVSPSVDTPVNVTVVWTGPNGTISGDNGRIVTADQTDSEPALSLLTISPLQSSDSGTYTCTASLSPNDPSFVLSSNSISDMLSIDVLTSECLPATKN